MALAATLGHYSFPLEQHLSQDYPFRGTVSRYFLYSVFSPKQLLLVPLDMSYGRFDFFAYWLSYGHFKMTPRCPMYRGVETPQGPKYRGVETPQCPMYQGVAIVDLLKIQNSPKYRGVETPWCPKHRGVKTL